MKGLFTRLLDALRAPMHYEDTANELLQWRKSHPRAEALAFRAWQNADARNDIAESERLFLVMLTLDHQGRRRR